MTSVSETADAAAALSARREDIVPGAGPDHCATAILAMVSPGGQMSVATAGHPPPLLREPDGTVRRLEDLGPMLGLPIDYTYTASGTRCAPAPCCSSTPTG